LLLVAILILFCAAPYPYRFRHHYTVPQAMRFVRQMLLDRGYQIAIFDTASGIIKTQRKEYSAGDGSAASHQISVTVVKPDELLIKVLPASARKRTAQIMEPITESLRAMGFTTEYTAISPPEP
jgi:hypothetical protein